MVHNYYRLVMSRNAAASLAFQAVEENAMSALAPHTVTFLDCHK